MNKSEFFGFIRFQLGQLQGYLGIASFVGVTYLVVRDNPFLAWYHIVTIMLFAIPVLLWFNTKYIFPSHQDYAYKKSPEWFKMRTEIKFIFDHVDKIINEKEEKT